MTDQTPPVVAAAAAASVEATVPSESEVPAVTKKEKKKSAVRMASANIVIDVAPKDRVWSHVIEAEVLRKWDAHCPKEYKQAVTTATKEKLDSLRQCGWVGVILDDRAYVAYGSNALKRIADPTVVLPIDRFEMRFHGTHLNYRVLPFVRALLECGHEITDQRPRFMASEVDRLRAEVAAGLDAKQLINDAHQKRTLRERRPAAAAAAADTSSEKTEKEEDAEKHKTQKKKKTKTSKRKKPTAEEEDEPKAAAAAVDGKENVVEDEPRPKARKTSNEADAATTSSAAATAAAVEPQSTAAMDAIEARLAELEAQKAQIVAQNALRELSAAAAASAPVPVV
jgi:hypothetical protein